MNEYELLYVVHPRTAADDVPPVTEWVSGLIRQAGGEVLTVDNWGRRRLAYPIDHEFEGSYVLTTLELPPDGPPAVEAQLVISEDIMRHILIRGIIPFERSDQRAEPAEQRAVAAEEETPPSTEPPAEQAASPPEDSPPTDEVEDESDVEAPQPSPAVAGAE